MSAVDVCKFPYLLVRALAEGVQLGLEIIGGPLVIPNRDEDICDEAEADEEYEVLLVHKKRSLWERFLA